MMGVTRCGLLPTIATYEDRKRFYERLSYHGKAQFAKRAYVITTADNAGLPRVAYDHPDDGVYDSSSASESNYWEPMMIDCIVLSPKGE